MGKIIETRIDRFDGGIVNDPRDPRENTFQMVTNFDVLTDSFRMRPARSSEDGDSSSSTNKIQNFCIGKLDTTPTYVLFGLGVQSGASDAKIFYKELTTADLEDATWAAATGGEQGTGTSTAFNLFVYYEKVNKIFGARDGTTIWSYVPSTGTFADTARSITYTHITQGVVHSKDDNLYFGYYNSANGTSAIARNNNDSWTDAAITLPTNLRIRSIAEFGNYLAIACEPVTGATPGFGHSIVYLWDRDATLATLSDLIYWGEERLFVLEEINGALVGVSVAAGSTRFDRRIVFRYLNVSTAEKIGELTSSSDVSFSLIDAKQRLNNRLYFMMGITVNGTFRPGVWSISKTPGGFVVTNERSLNNDTSFSQATLNLNGFHFVGDYLFQAYDISGTHSMAKTADSSTYSATSILETKLMNEGDSSLKKKLIGVTVTFEPLPSSGQVVLKYKKDEDSSYTTIFTETTDDAISHSSVNIESSGVGLPEFKEISFSVESTGGAIPTSLSWMSENVGKRSYMALWEAAVRWGSSLITK